MAEVDSGEGRSGSDSELWRWLRSGAGIFVATVGLLLFVSLFHGLREWIVDLGRLHLVVLLGLRTVAFAAVAWGCWYAYRNWRRL